MIGKLLRADFLKIKRKGLWFLTFLGTLRCCCLADGQLRGSKGLFATAK